MLLPYDPMVSLHLAGVRVTSRLTTLVLILVVATGASATSTDDHSPAAIAIKAVALIAFFAAFSLAVAGVMVRHLRRIGLGCRRVHLVLFGPVVLPERRAPTPAEVFGAGVPGAVAALALAGLVAGLDALLRGGWPQSQLAYAAAGLAAIQVSPTLPVAGGRILEAMGWYLTDTWRTGLRAAALYAHVMGAIIAGGGLLSLIQSGPLPYWGVGLLIAGWQLSGVTRWFSDQARLADLAGSHLLADLIGGLPRISGETTIGAAMDRLILAGPQTVMLVTSAGSRSSAVVRLADLRKTRRLDWDRTPISAVAQPLDGLPRTASSMPVADALPLVEDGQVLVVVDEAQEPRAVATHSMLIGQLLKLTSHST